MHRRFLSSVGCLRLRHSWRTDRRIRPNGHVIFAWACCYGHGGSYRSSFNGPSEPGGAPGFRADGTFSLEGRAILHHRPTHRCGVGGCGTSVLRYLFGNVFVLGANQPAGPIVQSLVMEVLVTAILMFVIAAVATDRRAKGLPAGLAIGGAVALNVLWAGPISGASMNLARCFGPVLISGVWTAHWIYWVGPIVGAALGASA